MFAFSQKVRHPLLESASFSPRKCVILYWKVRHSLSESASYSSGKCVTSFWKVRHFLYYDDGKRMQKPRDTSARSAPGLCVCLE